MINLYVVLDVIDIFSDIKVTNHCFKRNKNGRIIVPDLKKYYYFNLIHFTTHKIIGKYIQKYTSENFNNSSYEYLYILKYISYCNEDILFLNSNKLKFLNIYSKGSINLSNIKNLVYFKLKVPNISKIINLNFSNLKFLKRLVLSYNTNDHTLDLRLCSSLQEISISILEQFYKELYLPTYLKNLIIKSSTNRKNTLNLVNSYELKKLKIIDITIDHNTSVNFIGASNLQNLKYIYTTSNYFSSLNIEYAKNLKIVDLFIKNKENRYKIIDFSKHNYLEYLYIKNLHCVKLKLPKKIKKLCLLECSVNNLIIKKHPLLKCKFINTSIDNWEISKNYEIKNITIVHKQKLSGSISPDIQNSIELSEVPIKFDLVIFKNPKLELINLTNGLNNLRNLETPYFSNLDLYINSAPQLENICIHSLPMFFSFRIHLKYNLEFLTLKFSCRELRFNLGKLEKDSIVSLKKRETKINLYLYFEEKFEKIEEILL